MPKGLRTQTGYTLTAKDGGDTINLSIMDYIGNWDGEVSAKDVVSKLLEYPDAKTINVTVTSGGGDVFQGMAIYDALIAHPATVNMHGLGIVASIATVLFMAGDKRSLSENCQWMIHNASAAAWGNKEDVEKTLERLKAADENIAQIYANHCTQDLENIRDMMNKTTWLTANEALEKGFITEVTPAVKVAAVLIPSQTDAADLPPSTPSNNEPPAKQAGQPQEDITMSATLKEIVAACNGLDRTREDDSKFIMDQLDAEAAIDTVKANWTTTLKARSEQREKDLQAKDKDLQAKDDELQQLRADLEAAAKQPAGNKPVGEHNNGNSNANNETGDPVADFHEAVAAMMSANAKMDRHAAMVAVQKDDPVLHRHYVAATQKSKKAKRMWDDRFDD